MPTIINTILAGGGGGDAVTVEAVGAAKNAAVGDKVLLNTSLSSGAYFNPDRTPGETLTFCAWADLTNKKAYWIINGNSSTTANKDCARYDISDPNHVDYEGLFNLPTVPQTTYGKIVMGSDYLGCFGYTDNSNLYLMIKNNDGIMDGTLSQSFVCPTYWSISRNSNILCYYDGSASHVVRLTKNAAGTFDVTELTFSTTPTKPDVGTVSPDGTLIYYRRQIFKVNETTVDLINANSVGPSTSYSVEVGAFTDDNKYLFAVQRGTIYVMELGSDGSLPSVVSSTSSIGNTYTCHVYLCKNGYIQTSQGLLAYNQETGVVTKIWASGSTLARSSFTPITSDWSVGVDAPTGGLFALNGIDAPTQLPFSPLDTQATIITGGYNNYIISYVGTCQLNTTGINFIDSSRFTSVLKNSCPVKGMLSWEDDLFYNGTRSSIAYVGSVNAEEGFLTYNAGVGMTRAISSGVWETWTQAGSISKDIKYFVINGKAFGFTSSGSSTAINYKGTLDYENKTITLSSSSGHGSVSVLTKYQYMRVSKDQKYVFAYDPDYIGNTINVYSYDDATEVFSSIVTPNVIVTNTTDAITNLYFKANGDLVICSGQAIYTYSWESGDISTIVLKDVFTNPIPITLMAITETDEFYIFNRAVFSKGTSTEQVAEIYNGHNFNDTTLTGFVSKVNSDNTVEVKTVLP